MGTESLHAIHHIAVVVEDSDIGKAVDWYVKNTQCTVTYQDETWALLKFANISLAFVIPGQHPPHLCIETPDASKFGELKTHRDGTRSCYVRGPAGLTIEFMEPGKTSE